MEPEQVVIGHAVKAGEAVAHRLGILADRVTPCRGSIEADARSIRAMVVDRRPMRWTTVASLVNVMRIHSSASAVDVSDGFQARRPNACQLAQAKTEPHQLRSVPVFATPAIPVRSYP